MTWYSQGNGNWSTLANWNDAANGSGSAPAALANFDNVETIIQAGHNIILDSDLTGLATGIAHLTIQGHATTPAMLRAYGACGAVGVKIKTGCSLRGTTGAAKGRLLVNLNGVWGDSGDLAWGNTVLISLDGTANLDRQYLDCFLYCTNPANLYVTTYGLIKTIDSINTGTDVITMAGGAHGWAVNTSVMVKSSGALPAPLRNDVVYAVVSPSGADLKLSLIAGGAAIDITSSGSGTIQIYDGHTNTGTAVMNCFEDVTGDPQWASGAAVCLVNDNKPGAVDRQTVTLNGAPTSSTVTLSANVDGAVYPGSRVYLAQRNVAIRSNTTGSSNGIITSGSGTITHSCVWKCEIRATAGWTGTGTAYARGIAYGVGDVISGVVAGCGDNVYQVCNATISGIILAGTQGMRYGQRCTVTSTAIIAGNAAGVQTCTEMNFLGVASGNTYGAYTVVDSKIAGIINGGSYVGYLCKNSSFSGTIKNVAYRFVFIAFPDTSFISEYLVKGTADLPGNLLTNAYNNRNQIGFCSGVVRYEDYNGVLGAQYSAFALADAVKNTSELRGGGAASSLEVTPLSNCGVGGSWVNPISWTELAVPTGSKTKTIYVKGTGWSGGYPSNTELYLEAEYYSSASLMTQTTIASTEVLSDENWTALSVTFNPLQVGPVRYRVYLKKYDAGAAAKIYIDNALYTS